MAASLEKHAYWLTLVLLAISFTGLPVVKYAVYILPIPILLLAGVSSGLRLHIGRNILPFILLILLSLLTILDFDLNSVKKVVFIGVFTSIFMLIDFSRVRIDLRWFSALMVIVLFIRFAVTGPSALSSGTFVFSFIDSRSTLESTLAFPLAILGVYFLVTGRFVIALLHLLLVFLALKRVAVLGFFIIAMIWILPITIRRMILNPYVITLCIFVLLLFGIKFSQGAFNDVILDLTGKAANELSKGRELLWHKALEAVNYKAIDFMFFGVGAGKVVTVLQEQMHLERVLLHNDFLSLMLEFGVVATLLFAFLLNNQKSLEERALALFLSIIFFSDNVLIYQHVMLTYLFVQSQLRHEYCCKLPPPKKKHDAINIQQESNRCLHKVKR